MKKILTLLVIGLISSVFAVSFSPVPAQALAIIDFGTGLESDGGVLTWLGGNDARGEDIPIGVLKISGAPANNGTYLVTNGKLDFDTQLNTVTISGALPGLGIGDMVLLTGSFSSFTTSFLTNNFLNFDGSGPDVKARALLDALGMDPNTPFSFFGFTLSGQPIQGGEPNTFTATSTDFKNTEVPEPTTMLLLGSGLLGIGVTVRRKFGKKS
jgi:hypothetical protein